VTGTGAIVGLDFGGTKMAAAVADGSGRILGSVTVPTRPERGADSAMRRILDAAADLARRGNAAGRVGAAGVATMGIPEDNRVLFAPNVPGWEHLAIPSLVRARFPGAAVRADNDVKAAALAELMWGALRGVRTGIYLNLGTGLASALVIGGLVHCGAHGAAGEIGYAMRSPADRAGVRDGCAPIEQFFSGAGFRAGAPAAFGERLEAGEIFRLADAGDERAAAFIAERVGELAFHVANLAIAVDPERIAVGGGFMASAGRILPAIRDRLDRFVPFPPSLRVARFLHDAPLMGAVALGMDALRTQTRHPGAA
jgi:glucokinase